MLSPKVRNLKKIDIIFLDCRKPLERGGECTAFSIGLFKAKTDRDPERKEGGKVPWISQGASASVWCILRGEVAEECGNGLSPFLGLAQDKCQLTNN